MIAVITGDIINSRRVNSEVWLPKLKEYFSKIISDSEKWEIYGGDSFQIEINIEDALLVALCIKALIKSNSLIDVRLAIGLGDKNFKGKKVTESYGTAFINSGEALKNIKNTTIVISSSNKVFDECWNPILKLVSFISENWKPVTSQTLFFSLTHKNLLQKEVAERLSKDKTTVNKALKRGGYNEILDVLNLYTKMIKDV
jgi:hypothetical protein